MGWLDGFPFTSKEERERKRRDFEKRVAPFGVEEHREKLKVTLKDLFPDVDIMDSMFAFYDAKDAYTYKENKDEGYVAAKIKLKKARWAAGQNAIIMLRFIELESEIESLDEFPTADDVLAGLFEEE